MSENEMIEFSTADFTDIGLGRALLHFILAESFEAVFELAEEANRRNVALPEPCDSTETLDAAVAFLAGKVFGAVMYVLKSQIKDVTE